MAETTGAEESARHCTNCGERQQQGARFCASCGAKMPQAPDAGPFSAPSQVDVPQFGAATAPIDQGSGEAASTDAPQPPVQHTSNPSTPAAPQAAESQPRAEPSPIPQSGEMFCSSCGNVIKREAEICVKCGVRLRRAASSGGKSKVAAILLAVFLGFWAWLYTYREDGSKFWIALGISVVNVVLIIITLGFWVFIAWIPAFGFWLWPLIDAATRDDEWYASY